MGSSCEHFYARLRFLADSYEEEKRYLYVHTLARLLILVV